MTITNFKNYLAAYINRDLTSLTSVNSQDIVLQAMNDARRSAQRDHIFELNKTEEAYLSTHAGGANWMTAAKTTPGGATAQLMRRVDEVWTYSSQTIGATTYYLRTARVPYKTSFDFKPVMPTQGMNMQYSNVSPPAQFVQNMFAYSQGTQLYVTTVYTATIYKLIGIKWLDDLTGSEDPDIFLTFFTDWLLHASIAALNVYLKDGERFPVDVTVLARLWDSVKNLDGQMAQQGEAVNLD